MSALLLAHGSAVGAAGVSASLSSVSASPTTIADDGLDASTVTVTVLDTNGQPMAGIAAASCVLAVTGSGNTVTQPTGTTNGSGQISGSFVSTVAEGKTASFTVNGVAITDTATVTCSADGPTPQFASEWDAATGGSTTALGDGGQWDEISGRATDTFAGVQGGQVVTTGSIDFPTPNAYRGLLYAACDPCVRNGSDITAITTPAVGEYVHYRWYLRVQSEDGVSLGIMHWFHWGGITPYHELVAIGTVSGADSVEFGMWTNIQAGGSTLQRITTQISPNTTYRLTMGLRRHATNEARVQYMKLYNTSNTLLVDTGDWTVEGGGTLTNLPMSLYSIPGQIFRRFQIGPNDSLISGYSGPTNFLYHSGVAALGSASASDELGPL